ncbi:MAG: right-handed parallel beta-helix repeat-containing protein [Phycisphaerales bacterium]|nr:right-handed parallel beta-helix repeat-containing protein [Phycisphaerales bacterium]
MDNSRYMITLAATCTTILVATSMLARGGPLTPPAGPVAPTMVTLDTVEPRIPIGPDTTPGDSANLYRISEPGSYILTANLTGESGKTGIRVDASNVTLDLRGFTLTGVAGSREGIRIGGNDVIIRNGFITNWERQGIRAFSELSQRGAVIENVHAIDNGDDGIEIFTGGVLRHCVARSNDAHGFKTNSNCLIEACISRNNIEDGFNTASGCIFRGCAAYQNFGNGFHPGSHSQLSECIGNGNTLSGFDVPEHCVLTACAAGTNFSNGFSAAGNAVMRGCSAGVNGAAGFDTGPACVVTETTAASNQSAGISTGSGSVATCSTARGNQSFGVIVAEGGAAGFLGLTDNLTGIYCGGTLVASGAFENQSNGIEVRGMAAFCAVEDNQASGISANGSSRIHGCVSFSNDVHGFTQAGTPNIFSANSAFFNGDQNYQGTYTNQNTTTPIGAGPWQNTANALP